MSRSTRKAVLGQSVLGFLFNAAIIAMSINVAASLIGGILDDSQTKSLSGIPGLAQIPILKYLFGQTSTDHSEDETVFAITPHIIRGADVSELNQREIEIGTANAIELRRVSSKSVAPAGQASASPNANRPPAGQPSAAQQPTPGAPAANGAASFLFDPPTIQATKGNTFAVNLLISGAQNVYSVPVQLNYDPRLLQLVNVSDGGFLSQDGQAVVLVKREEIGQLLPDQRARGLVVAEPENRAAPSAALGKANVEV
jgi:general secretion pathway protein D